MILKVSFANSVDPDQTASGSSLIRVHIVLLYAKIGLKGFARIFSRRHKQATFSDTGFRGILRVKTIGDSHSLVIYLFIYFTIFTFIYQLI